jgi:aryl-alcohol dehydrogenase-like predicted oxidoreductase
VETRSLGRDGPPLTRLGLGLAALGRPAYITLGHGEDLGERRGAADLEARAHAVLDAAYEAGIRYADAARSYGRAEDFLRSWLVARGRTARDVVVGSKWGYRYVGAWRLDAVVHEVKDHSLGALRAQLAESDERLGPWLSLYQIHSATPESGVLADGAVLDALAALRDRGVRVGVTVSGVSQATTVREALAVRRGGAPLFQAVQATWNVLERSAEAALAEAHGAGVTVIVKEALANGRLTARGDAARAGPLAEASRELSATPDALALAAALAQPWADVVLLGAATVDQLRSNLRALDVPSGRALVERFAPFTEPAGDYWSRRSRLPWR